MEVITVASGCSDGIGGIQPSAKTCLQNHIFRLELCKKHHRHTKEQLEIGGMRQPVLPALPFTTSSTFKKAAERNSSSDTI